MRALAAAWPTLADLVSKLAHNWEVLNDIADDLNMTDILAEQMKPERRFLLDRWLSTIHRIDEHFEEASDVVADFEDAMEESERVP